MDLQLLLALALAALVGVSLGLLGGGGSILTVPILTYVLGMEPREAIASSLFIVGVTSAVSLIRHAQEKRVRYATGVLFGGAGMVGAFAGGIVGGYLPGAVLMILFAVMMIVTATAMLRRRATGPKEERARADMWRILLDGFFVGIATGLVGAGGGFLIVPALNLLGGLPMAAAVGTSLLVIVLKSFAGFGGYLLAVQIQWTVVLAFTAVAASTSFIGAALAGRVPEASLRRGFGLFVLAMGVLVLLQEALPLLAGS